ncbi:MULTISPECIES: AAA family ATPase [unclassified Sphingobium]|uniref:AAA family ATPase n=1 Tax=unclassified Sphingobium TaxID=2611147 RepID=UPI0035A6AED6
MNNVNEIEETDDFIADQRAWLLEHKSVTGQSWTQIAQPIGRKSGTLSVFAGGKYNGGPYAGGNGEIAKLIYRYRQTLNRQSELSMEAPDIPGFFETRTALDIMNLLSWAQTRGRICVWAGGAGTGKTEASKEYAARASNVWHVEFDKSVNSISALCIAVLMAMRDFTPPIGAQKLSAYVANKLRDSQGLLILDEAQHLDIEQIEVVRSWYDRTGVGIALLGNESVISRMNGGVRKAEFAQLSSRVGLSDYRAQPLRDDVEAFAAAWNVQSEDILKFLHQIALKPGALRSATYTMEIAVMLARGENSELMLKHVQAAHMQRAKGAVAA